MLLFSTLNKEQILYRYNKWNSILDCYVPGARAVKRVWLILLATGCAIFRVKLLTNCRTIGYGHLAEEPALLLARRRLGHPAAQGWQYVLVSDGCYANLALAQLWRRFFYLPKSKLVNKFWARLSRFSRITLDIGIAPPDQEFESPKFRPRRNSLHAAMLRDFQRYRDQFPAWPLLEIPSGMKDQGREALRRLGVREGEWFVCLNASEISLDGNWSYDPLRRQRIEDFVGAMEEVCDLGGKVIRFGDSKTPSLPFSMPLIDYPKSSEKSDWMDLFLTNECRFFVGSQSGPQCLAMVLGKPQLLTNIIHWCWANVLRGDIYLPKLILEKKTGRIISLQRYEKEVIEYGFLTLPDHLEAVPNTAEDLKAAVREMDAQLWKKQLERGPLQELWKRSFLPEMQVHVSEGIVSPSFLKKYRNAFWPDLEAESEKGAYGQI